MNTKRLALIAAAVFACVAPLVGRAQTLFQEDFTGTKTNNNWFFFNGACLTAGTGTSTSSPGPVPGCVTVFQTYYGVNDSSSGRTADGYMTGGHSGYLGASSAPTVLSPVSSTPQTADPVVTVNGTPTGMGALRFTNGYPYGYHQNGAIVSAFTVPSGQGLEITFKTTTYLGNSGGAGKDGADGISFYLLDGCMPVTGGSSSGIAGASPPSGCTSNPIYGTGNTFSAIGAWGGSLAYTCSNSNAPYQGLTGAYIGLGIDEYGNFLNGTSNTLGETGTSPSGDNTASGGGYQPGRIGLRGAGSVSWQALTTAYGTYSSAGPYYPSSLATTCSNGAAMDSSGNCGTVCSTGSYNSSSNKCDSCPAGYTFNSSTNKCTGCSAGGTYDPATNSCSNPAYTCPNGATYIASTNSCSPVCSSGSFNSGTSTCNVCSSGQTFDYPGHATSSATPCAACSKGGSYSLTTGKCSSGSLSWNKPSSKPSANLPVSTLTTTTASSSVTPTGGKPLVPAVVQKVCSTGHLWNYSNPASPTDAGPATLPTDPTSPNSANTAGILDYPAIPGAYSVLSGITLANESATVRDNATPILYDVKVTQDGLLSLAYSTNGTNYTSVIKNQKITDSNGPLPAYFRFGFAGSTGGSTNVHEIECFKAGAASQSASSTTANQKQSAKVTSTTQAYFAYYNPSNNTGSLSANYLTTDSSNNILVNPVANWDAQCVLTGTDNLPGKTCSTTGLSTPQSPQGSGNRAMLTFDGTQGIPFKYDSLTANQQAVIDNLDATQTDKRVNYLRGDTGNEVNSFGSGLFRARDGILGDIIDSSPSWVGPPQSPYTIQWKDALHSSIGTPENSKPYSAFVTQYQTRQNVVYIGANDGFVHGFRTGSFNSSGTFSSTGNDGKEVLAYMPAAVLNTIHTVAQNSSGIIDGTQDFSNTQYVHNFFVDGPPGTFDLFYGNAWHTWLVGGLGSGGAALYALDATDPSQFSESNASSLVIGEWTPSTITCSGTITDCGGNLGNTYGQPQVRRLHDGNWGVILGNGLNSATGDAGIFVMVINQSDGSKTFYYLSTGTAGTKNGIAWIKTADLDSDHITDYIYAGDVNGNLWRFDLTSSSETEWAASSFDGSATPTPLFKAPAGQPITSAASVAFGFSGGGQQRVLIVFGTGQKFPNTTTTAVTYTPGQQAFYGVWDWNMTTNVTSGSTVIQKAWNNQSPIKFAGLAPGATGLTGAIGQADLVQQIISVNAANGDRDIATNADVCWKGTSTCSSGNNQFGWYLLFPDSGEQVIAAPDIGQQSVTFNSIEPATNIPTACTLNTDKGFSYDVNLTNGGAFVNAFPAVPNNSGLPQYHDTDAAGIQTNATGSSFLVSNSSGSLFIVFQTIGGTPDSRKLNLPAANKARRLTWTQLR